MKQAWKFILFQWQIVMNILFCIFSCRWVHWNRIECAENYTAGRIEIGFNILDFMVLFWNNRAVRCISFFIRTALFCVMRRFSRCRLMNDFMCCQAHKHTGWRTNSCTQQHEDKGWSISLCCWPHKHTGWRENSCCLAHELIGQHMNSCC